MRIIILTTGEETLVSDIDFDLLNQWDWTLLKGAYTNYAARGIRVNGYYSKIMMHIVVLERVGINVQGLEVDHGDRNGLNNQRENLQAVTKAVNQQRNIERKDCTSGIKGVNFDVHANKWRARLQINGLRINVGLFETMEEAETRLKETRERYRYGKT